MNKKLTSLVTLAFVAILRNFLHLCGLGKDRKFKSSQIFKKNFEKKKSYQKWPKLKNCYFLPQHHKVLLFIAGLRIWVLAFSVLFLTKDQPHLNNAKWCRVKICNSAWFWHHLKIASFRSCTTTSKRSSSITSKTSLCIHGWI